MGEPLGWKRGDENQTPSGHKWNYLRHSSVTLTIYPFSFLLEVSKNQEVKLAKYLKLLRLQVDEIADIVDKKKYPRQIKEDQQ